MFRLLHSSVILKILFPYTQRGAERHYGAFCKTKPLWLEIEVHWEILSFFIIWYSSSAGPFVKNYLKSINKVMNMLDILPSKGQPVIFIIYECYYANNLLA